MKWILSLIFLFSTLASAKSSGFTASQVASLFYSSNCQNHNDGKCRSGVTLQFLGPQEIQALPQTVKKQLFERAYEQAQIWGDTILEGEYAASGDLQLRHVVIIRQYGELMGFTISYSEKAWFTGNCMYVTSRPETLSKCKKGQILEGSFVSTDLSEAIVDENQFASFFPEE